MTEGTDPLFVVAAVNEILIVLGLHAERTELPCAYVVFFLVDMELSRRQVPQSRIPFPILLQSLVTSPKGSLQPALLRLGQIILNQVVKRGLIRYVN